MPAITANPWVKRLALIGVVAFIALCIAMCGPSHENTGSSGKPTVTATPPNSEANAAPSAAPPGPPPPPQAKDYVEGMIQSVSGGTVGLRTRSGSATVDFTPETRVVEVTPAALADVTPGSCINVKATPQSAPPTGGAITAQAVTITSAIDGKCPPPAGFYGTVASVSGNTIAVNGLGPGGPAAPINVTVADATSYQKQTPSDAQAIVNGKCMGAQGTQEGGALHAVMISLETCPPMGHHHHLPHLPHLHVHL